MKEAVFVSGLYSGPHPSAGLGVARSLRAAFPSARIVGVDYWAGSSGLHHEVFNSTWLKPSWDLIEESLYANELQVELDRGAFWIPTLDLEIAWLARTLPLSRGLLCPNESALASIRKPRPAIAEMLGLSLPPTIDLASSDDCLQEFCRVHSWRVWVKGPYHEAISVNTWPELERARGRLRRRWRSDRLSLQAHVRGHAESVCLSAVGGELVDAVHMRKRIVTEEGKTWAGRISDVPPDLLSRVEETFRAIRWSGGAELELARDVDGQPWMLECNPRFPGWIHGATLAGRNLPGGLVRRALGLPDAPRTAGRQAEFTRVVLELPVRGDLPLPPPPEPEDGRLEDEARYGAALSAIMSRLPLDATTPSVPPAISPESESDLRVAATIDETPRRLFLPRTAEAAFARLETVMPTGGATLRHAYSLQTGSDPEYLALARRAGMLAECTNLREVRRAREAGWAADEILLDGPGKWWPAGEAPVQGLRAVFCDSIEELGRLATSGRSDRLWGVRLRVPGLRSRLGVPVEEPASFDRLCAAVSGLPPGRSFGVQVDMASALIGVDHWRDVLESALSWAVTIESTTGRRVRALDLGGEYHPADLARIPFPDIARSARQSLPELEELTVEPGRALTGDSMAVVTRVLDVRRRNGKVEEIVVDTCVAELPLAAAHPHRMFRIEHGRPVPAARGPVRVLGRIGTEDDVVAPGLDLPDDVAVGERLVLCDAGGREPA